MQKHFNHIQNINGAAGHPKNIIWLQTAFLGDIILSTAALNLAARLFPRVRQFLITTPVGAAALRDHPSLNGIVAIDKKKNSILTSIKKIKNFCNISGINKENSILLQPHQSLRSSLIAWATGLPVVTFDDTSMSFLATRTVPRISVMHETERIALLLTKIGIDRSQVLGVRPGLSTYVCESDDGIFMKSKLVGWKADQLVGVSPGSTWGTKRWPATYYAELIKQLHKEYALKFVLLGDASENNLCKEIVKASGGADVENLAGETSLDDLRAIYPRLSLLIANDSSAIHYASAFNVPTIALFGATVPGMGFGPLADISISIEEEIHCRPCGDHGPKSCPLSHFHCMRNLTPSRVLREIKQLSSVGMLLHLREEGS